MVGAASSPPPLTPSVLRRLVAHGHVLCEDRLITLVLPRRTLDIETQTAADAAALAATLARLVDAAHHVGAPHFQ